MTDLPPRYSAALANCISPESAEAPLQRLLGQEQGLASFEALSELALERTLSVLGLGGACAQALESELGIARLFGSAPRPMAELRQSLARADDDSALTELRHQRRAIALQIAAIELGSPRQRGVDTEGSSAMLSELAAAILQQLLEVAGIADEVAIIALGKMGGWELNYASDIDLLFVCREAPARYENALRQLIAKLELNRAPTRLYRVDLRLRPYGRSGPLVSSLAALQKYYERSAAPWERQAMIRASHGAGSTALSAEVFAALESFRWKNPVDDRAIQSLLELRRRTRAQTRELDRHLKQGPGGIREIEAVSQFLLMLHAADQPDLRKTGTRPALRALSATGILAEEEARRLLEGYSLQRKLEHLLQLQTDREHELLPTLPTERRRLASYCGLSETELFDNLAALRQHAARVLDGLIEAPFARSKPTRNADLELRDLLLADKDGRIRGGELMAQQGFKDGAQAFQHLRSIGTERSLYLAPSGRARTLLAGLAPSLLELVAHSPNPDRSLRNLALAVDTLGAKATFLQLLLSGDDSLPLFVKLASVSDFLIETLARRPKVLDEVIDRLQTRHVISHEGLREELADAIRPELSLDQAIESLRTIKAISTLQIGIHDLAGRYNAQNIGRDLSALAEVVLEGLFDLALREGIARHGGRPRSESQESKVAILAVGKLGAREISYGSDFDLIAVFEGQGECPDGLPAQVFFQELLQRMLQLGDRRDASGPLAPMDMRLRPAGNQGLLCCSLELARTYYRGSHGSQGPKAALWECLALTRLRAVAGDPELQSRAESTLRNARHERPIGPELWDEVQEMRRRQLEKSSPNDIKLGAGGLADIEFLVMALALRHSRGEADLEVTGTAPLVRALTLRGLLREGESMSLLSHYQFLRRLEARIRVVSGHPGSLLPNDPQARRELALALDYVDSGQSAEQSLWEELDFTRRELSSLCQSLEARDRKRSP